MPPPKTKRKSKILRNLGVRVQKEKQLFKCKSLYGTAVEEVDPFIFDDTYCVLSEKFGKAHIFRFSASRSLFIFGPMTWTRQFCVFLLTHPWYDIFIVIVIFANCLALAFDSNVIVKDKGADQYHTIDYQLPRPVELAFLAIYTLEMILKIIAKGFILSKFSYMRNAWNVLDFVIVVSGLVVEAIAAVFETHHKASFDLEVFRTFRVLRVIKTISILPGLRLMINSLANSVVQLLEVMALTFFCLCVFSLFALEVFFGKMHSVCVLKKGSAASKSRYATPNIEDFDPNSPFIHEEYRAWVTNEFNWQMRDFPEEEFSPCSNDSGRLCEEGYVCLPDLSDNPQDGWISFDHFGFSLLSSFQLLTLDYWERLYDLVISFVGPISLPFFVVVVFFGAFYLLNLMLAVVTMSYEREAHVDEKEPPTKYQKLTLHRTDSTFSFDDPFRLNPAIMTKFRKRTPSERELLGRAIRSSDKDDQPDHRADIASTTFEFMGRISFANIGPPPSSFFNASSGTGVPEKSKEVAKKVERPRRSRDAVLTDTYLLAKSFEMTAMMRMAESIMAETSDRNTGDTQQTGKSGNPAKYNNDERSEDDMSVLSADYIEDIDQYSGSSQSSANNKARTKPPTYNVPLRILRTLKRRLTVYVNSAVFETFITLCILGNTILLASEHHGQTQLWTDVLEAGSYLFMAIFVFECVLKIAVLQEDYFYDNWNRFDFLVVCLSVFDTIADSGIPGGQAFRTFRLLRIFKLANSWITMKILLNIIFSTFGALGNLILIMAIFIYIFAILGMQLIGKEYLPHRFGVSDKEDDGFPRWRFENFWFSFMMVFRVLCQEWIEPLWDCLKAQEEDPTGRTKCFLIFLPVLIIGNFIILNLFLALLLDSFNSEEIKSQRQKVQGTSHRAETLRRVTEMLLNRRPTIVPDESASENEENDEGEDGTKKAPKEKFKLLVKKLIVSHRKAAAERAILRAGGTNEYAQERFQKNPLLTTKENFNLLDTKTPSQGSLDAKENRKNRIPDPCLHPFCLSCRCRICIRLRRKETPWWNGLRKYCLRVVTDPLFEWGILALIVASSITLCFEDIYLDEKPALKFNLFVLNCAFTITFIVEMFLKFIGLGIHKYFTTFWTILDFFIVVVSLVGLAMDIESESWKVVAVGTSVKGRQLRSLGSLKALRTLRALRPLRAISRWQGMKVVVNALTAAIPSIFNVLLVCLLFWLVFAIMGVQFFRGKFFRCVFSDTAIRVHHSIVPNKQTCCERNTSMSWINLSPNFDNVFEGYLSLFQIATFEGWMELMEAATDVRAERGLQPRRDEALLSYVFFVIFIVFGSFFTLNLFIGVIIDNFNILKKKYEGNLLEVFLTEGQKKYYTTMKKLGKKKPRAVLPRPRNSFLAMFYDIANSRKFEILIFVMIFLNMIVIATDFYGNRDLVVGSLNTINVFFSIVYVLEAFIKILGLRQHYFKVPWNVFDFILVILSILDIFIDDIPFPPSLLRVIRVFRIGRIIRLIKAAKGIRKLLFALVVSLPALFNIGALLALIIFIYAILGMALFKDAAPNTAIDQIWSFQTFLQSAMLLFRLMTAAGWNEVLDALSIEFAEPGCGTWRKFPCGGEDEPECINRMQAIVYMVSFLIITNLIVVNMYIAVILENYDEASKDEEVGIVEDDLDMFYIRWSSFDPNATQFIHFDHLSEFLSSLDPPLCVPRPNYITMVYFNLPISRGNRIHCLDILHALVGHVLGHIEDTEEFRKIQDQMESKFRRLFPNRRLLDVISSTRVWKIQHNAARMIQRYWRAYCQAKALPFAKLKRSYSISSIGDTASERKLSRKNRFFKIRLHRQPRRQSFLRRLSFTR